MFILKKVKSFKSGDFSCKAFIHVIPNFTGLYARTLLAPDVKWSMERSSFYTQRPQRDQEFLKRFNPFNLKENF